MMHNSKGQYEVKHNFMGNINLEHNCNLSSRATTVKLIYIIYRHFVPDEWNFNQFFIGNRVRFHFETNECNMKHKFKY